MYFKSSNCKNIATNILEFPIFVKNNVFNEIRAIKIFCRVSGLIRKRQKYKIVILNKHFLKQQSFTKIGKCTSWSGKWKRFSRGNKTL